MLNSDNNQFSLVVHRLFSATYWQCSKLVGSKHILLWGFWYSRHWERSSKGMRAVRHAKMQWNQSFTQRYCILKLFLRFLSAAKWETQMRDTTQLLNRWVTDTGHRCKHAVHVWLLQASACTWMSLNYILRWYNFYTVVWLEQLCKCTVFSYWNCGSWNYHCQCR